MSQASEPSDPLRSLLQPAYAGLPQARQELIERLLPTFRRAINKVFKTYRDEEDIKEVLHACVIALLEALDEGVSIESPRAYAYRLARNQACGYLEKTRGDRHQRLAGEVIHPSLEWTRTDGNAPEKQLVARSDWLYLKNLVWKNLTEAERRVFELHFEQDLDAGEVASRLDICRNNVYQIVNRIRRYVNALFEGADTVEPP